MSDAQKTPAAAPKTSRWPSILLAVSLTLNLLVLGVVAGANFRDDRDTRQFPGPDRAAARDMGFGPFIDALPRNVRGSFGQAIRDRSDTLRPDRNMLAREFSGMLQVLRTEPYDGAALETLMVAQQARSTRRIATGREILLEQIQAMTPRERAQFADELQRRVQNGPPPM